MKKAIEGLAKKVEGQTMVDRAMGMGNRAGGSPTYSEIAAGAKQPSTVEVRIDQMEVDGKEDLDDALNRIKQAIPEAKALRPHPRAKDKFSVVVGSDVRRDQILAHGLPKEAEGVRLIRRPYVVMVLGVPMDTRIENYDCPKNQEWIQNARKKNNDARILRVGWLYKRKRLEELRKNQTKSEAPF